MLVPDMNSDNFNNYYYELNVSDKGRYEGTTTLNSAYIYDYNRSMKVGTFDCTKEALLGDKLSLPTINLINSYDFKVTDENVNAVDVLNVWSDNYVNNPVLKPFKSVELTSNTGGSNGNGTISFSKPGTYKITAWVNAENDFSSESGGINSANNKRTITVDVEPYRLNKIYVFLKRT